MLEMIAEYYTMLLAVLCVVFLNRFMNKQLMMAFAFAFCFVYSLDFMQAQFGWWAMFDGHYIIEAAASALMVCALLCFNMKLGIIALVGLAGYAFSLYSTGGGSWVDIVSSFAAGLPSYILFSAVGEDKSDSTLDT